MLQHIPTAGGSTDTDRGFPIVIASVPASARQRRVAFAALVILVVFIALTIPVANIKLARVDAFVPVIQTAMCLADLLTAALLFAEYSVYPRRAMLALAGGYIFSGLFGFLQTLAFPGAYAPVPLIGETLDSAGWLFVFWHTTFPLAVIVYALSKDAVDAAGRPGAPARVTIRVTIACVLAATAGLTLLAAKGAAYLPPLFLSVTHFALGGHAAKAVLALLNVAALVALLVRKRTVLDYWLIVVLAAWAPDFVVSSLLTVDRFTVGWYAFRVFALCAGSFLLFALLAETVVMYARVANAFEHQKLLVGELDHRVKNVLARVAAVVEFTRQGSSSVPDFARAITGRLHSMADAHGLLSQSSWQGVGLGGLVRKQLAPYATKTNVTIDGADVVLGAAATQAIAMVLHELVSNSAKYGALSSPNGQVSVRWQRRPNGAAVPMLRIEWRERDGPPVSASVPSGYGTDLIRNLVPHELGGTVDLVFASEGVSCDIETPLAQW
jgi:two-component sensor histidine kinase